jgi:hypothetical protein
MLDSLRNLRLSKEEIYQEAITAYLDDVLSPKERERFERQMASEPALRAEVEVQGRLRYQLKQLPRQAAPRNYTLDPAVYGRPDQAKAPLMYPFLRGATVMVGLLFIVALTAQLLFGSQDVVRLADIAPAAESVQELADDSFFAEAEKAASEPATDELASGSEIQEAPVSVLEGEVVKEEEGEEPLEEAMAPEIVLTVVVEAEEVEMPAEDSAVGGALASPTQASVSEGTDYEAASGAPAGSPPLRESEADRAVAPSDGSLVTAVPTPTSQATIETELALSASPPAQARPTRQAVATPLTQRAETAAGQIAEDTAGAPDDALFDPLQLLPAVVVVLGIIALLLAGLTLLIRRRL